MGTSICGNTAIVAVAPTIGAKDEETSYAVACITVFGLVAMLAYPFAAHWLFGGDAFRAGLFLGTAVHDTSQVAGAGMVYQQYFNAPAGARRRDGGEARAQPVDAARHSDSCRSCTTGAQPRVAAPPAWWTLVPLFVVGFAVMSAIRSIGDMGGDRPFGVLDAGQWKASCRWHPPW